MVFLLKFDPFSNIYVQKYNISCKTRTLFSIFKYKTYDVLVKITRFLIFQNKT